MKNDQFLSRVHAELIISIGVESCVSNAIADHMKASHGDDWYGEWRKAVSAANSKISLKNISMLDACKFAERLRIAKPDSHVNVESPLPGGDFICNVTWNAQCTEFLEYETYTDEGAAIIAAIKNVNETEEMMQDTDMPSFIA